MLIKFLIRQSGTRGITPPGAIREVFRPKAEVLIKHGLAVEVDQFGHEKQPRVVWTKTPLPKKAEEQPQRALPGKQAANGQGIVPKPTEAISQPSTRG